MHPAITHLVCRYTYSTLAVRKSSVYFHAPRHSHEVRHQPKQITYYPFNIAYIPDAAPTSGTHAHATHRLGHFALTLSWARQHLWQLVESDWLSVVDHHVFQ